MNSVISELIGRFDAGRLTRRELIQGLSILAAAGAVPAARAQSDAFVSSTIDHISIQTSDLPESIEFYATVFGLSILNQDEENEIVRMGRTRIIVSLHHKEPTGIVDHFAIGVEDFDTETATARLARHGLTAEQNLDYGFHVRDPQGIPVQIVGAR